MARSGTTGIYEIVNLVNGKRYVGSGKHCEQRWNNHKTYLRQGRHHSRYLQASWNKYNPEDFEFRVILVCRVTDLLFYEQAAIDSLQPEYNINRIAGNSLGCIRTPETRAKIAAKAIGRVRDRDSVERGAAKLRGIALPPERVMHLVGNKHALGLKHTEQWKAEISAKQMGRKCPKSPEQRAKISASLAGVTHSQERRAAQSAGQLGKKRGPYKLDPAKAQMRAEAGRRLAALQIGKSRSPQSVAKMRASLTGRTLTPEHKAAIGVGLLRAWNTTRRRKKDPLI